MDRQFANPSYWLLLLPPIIGLLHFRFLKLRQKTLTVISPINAPATVSPFWPGITSIAFLLVVIAWLRPQWGFELEERQQSGVDIVIAVDVSPSMLASDTPPSRLKLAQRAIIDLLSRLQGDKVALVAFSGVAFTETPLTLDYSTFRLFLNQLSPDLIPLRGTNIELALRESLKTLLPSEEKEDSLIRARAIILITDGESFAGDIDSVVSDLQDNAVDLSIISVGTETGAPVPGDIGYKRHNDGSTVISRLDVKALKGLAEVTSGHYYNLNQSSFDLGEVYENGIKKRLTATVEEGGQVKVWGE
ncbi:MAG: VWA domain-containing protein, partial [bacterium]|nr:VWA domain-containing protein [bacterium]